MKNKKEYLTVCRKLYYRAYIYAIEEKVTILNCSITIGIYMLPIQTAKNYMSKL